VAGLREATATYIGARTIQAALIEGALTYHRRSFHSMQRLPAVAIKPCATGIVIANCQTENCGPTTMVVKRNRSKQTLTLDERLRIAARDARQRAEKAAGEARDALLKKARAYEAQVVMNQDLRKGGY
jgi:hypothetical protein